MLRLGQSESEKSTGNGFMSQKPAVLSELILKEKFSELKLISDLCKLLKTFLISLSVYSQQKLQNQGYILTIVQY